MQVAVRCDLVQSGLTEDGEAAIRRRYYVVAEVASGARWAHDYGYAEEAGADALRGRVAAHLEAGGVLNEAHWYDIDPAYGSAAYQGLDDQGFYRARERQEVREVGEVVGYDEPCDVWFA